MTVKYIIGGLLVLALIFAGIFCVTFSTVTQSIPLIMISIVAIMAIVYSKKSVSRSNLGLKILVIVTCLYFFVRAYFSPVTDLARQDMFLISSAALVYSIIGIVMPSKMIRTWLIRGFIAVMILNLLNWIPAVDQWRDATLNYARGEWNTGLFNHRNFYGNFMFMMTCLCFSFALFNKDKGRIRIGYLILTVFGGVSVVLSNSRASFLALIVGLAVIVVCWMISSSYLNDRVNKMRQLLLVFALLVVITTGLFVGGKYLLKERDRDMTDSNGRAEYFGVALEQIPDAPVIGSGSRSIEYKSYEYWPISMRRNTLDFKFVHNEYIQAITDYGIIGCILLISILFWHIINGMLLLIFQLTKKETGNLIYLVSGLSILIGLTINMLFSFPLHGFVNLLLIVFGATLLLGPTAESRLNQKEEMKTGSIGSRGLFYLTVSVLFLVVSFVFTEGKKELLAGSSFWKENITSDALDWSLENCSEVNWAKALTGAIQHSPTYERHDRLGEILYANGKLDDAYDHYRLSKQRHPYSPVSRISMARLLAEKGAFKEAEREYKEVEYLVKNREPLFYFYRNLAEFYLTWSQKDENLKTENLKKAREACEKSIEKCEGHVYIELRVTALRVLRSSYYDLMEREEYDEAFRVFDEYVSMGRGYGIRIKGFKDFIMPHAKEILRHAQFAWSRGQLERAAKATYRAHVSYWKFKKVMNGNVSKSWNVENNQINRALRIFNQAGVKIDKK